MDTKGEVEKESRGNDLCPKCGGKIVCVGTERYSDPFREPSPCEYDYYDGYYDSEVDVFECENCGE